MFIGHVPGWFEKELRSETRDMEGIQAAVDVISTDEGITGKGVCVCTRTHYEGGSFYVISINIELLKWWGIHVVAEHLKSYLCIPPPSHPVVKSAWGVDRQEF